MGTAPARLWWLYGPPCAGKSVTAWELFTHVAAEGPRAYFDVDQVGMCSPEPADDPGRHALKSRAASALVRHLAAAGARTVIVSGVLDRRSLTDIVEQVAPVEVRFCRLRVAREELRRRLETRYGPNDVARALAEADEWDRGGPDLVVDTGAGDLVDAAREVVAALAAAEPSGSSESATPAPPAPPAVTTGPGRAVLICGPTGVGKSTIGFAALMQLLAAGRTAAYLDLQQLGFLADLPATASRHQIVAGGVVDLWQEYRSVGAEDLVITGQIERPDDVQRYREALGTTPLLVCRLQVDRPGLRERIEARTRGGGPALAGDVLVGMSEEEAGAVLQRALTEQSRLQEREIADVVLDTTGQAAEAVAQLLLTALDPGTGSHPSR